MVVGVSTVPTITRPPSPAVTTHGPAGRVWHMTSIAGVLEQSFSQPSPLTMFPSSHCSPGSTLPSPQVAGISLVQVDEQPSPLTRLPSSHPSPGSRLPSPHFAEISFLQV